jgi:hypothetical protein
MGSMSASDAAPLPRLGEVFFDVRGSSRSMRLSWYAETGVAVFSIWQGGMCTGTFRLPIDDLPRMVETLRRGPGGQPSGQDPAGSGDAFGDVPMDATAQVPSLEPLPGEELPGFQQGVPGYGPGSAAERAGEQPDYRTGATEYLAERPDHRTAPAPYLTRASEYPAEPADHRATPTDYLSEPPDRWAGPADYRADPADHLAGPADHLAEAPGRRADYLADPPGSGPEGGLDRNGHPGSAGSPGYGETPYGGRRSDVSYPGLPDSSYSGARSDASYPGARSDASYPGAGSEAPYPGRRPDATYPGAGLEASYPGAGSEAPYPGRRSDVSYPGLADASYPGASTGGPNPRGTTSPGRRPGGLADEPYLGGTGPMDFQAEPPPAHYPPGSSAPGHGDTPGRSTADYPAHYGAAVTDDIAASPPPESFPYGQPPGNRSPAGRHADPDPPFD